MPTKGASGNLVNRYRAVLKKCRLINTFGSLAVAGALVLGVGSDVRAATTSLSSLGHGDSITIESGDYTVSNSTVVAYPDNTLTVNGGSLAVTDGRLWGNKGNPSDRDGWYWNDGMTFTVNGGQVTLSDTRGSTNKLVDQTCLWAGQANITGGTITIGGNDGLGGPNEDLVNIAGYKGMSITGGEITLNPTSELIAGSTNGMRITGGTIIMKGDPNKQDSQVGSAQIRCSSGTSNIIGGDARIIVPADKKGILLTGEGLTMQGGTLEAEGTLAIQVNRPNGNGGTYHPEFGTFTQSGGTIRVGDHGRLSFTDGMPVTRVANDPKPLTVNINDGATVQVTGSGKVDVAAGNELNFASGSLLDVSAESASDGKGVIQGDGDVTAVDGAKMRVNGAKAGQTYTVVKLDSGQADIQGDAWAGDNFLSDSSMLKMVHNADGTFTSAVESASSAFPGLDGELGRILEQGYANDQIGGSHVDADAPGARFLSRTTNNTGRYLADADEQVATLESAATMGLSLAPHMTWAAHNAAGAAVAQRTALAQSGGNGLQSMSADSGRGFALWFMPLYQNWNANGLSNGSRDLDTHADLGGVALGADYTFNNLRSGLALNIGGGHAKGSGGINDTSNDFNFWGLGAYAGWTRNNFGLASDVNFTGVTNELEQNMPASLGMSDLKSDIDSWALSAGLRGEYKLETSVLDIVPHAGVRYTWLNTDSYDVKSGGTMLNGDAIRQNIWTFPVGVAFSRDITTGGGWRVKPALDLAVIPAAGDVKARGDVRFTGVTGKAEMKTQVLDYVTYMGQVGLELGKDNISFGLDYKLQAGARTTAHGVFGMFRYEF